MGLSHEPTSVKREALGRFLRWHLGAAGPQDGRVMSAISRMGRGVTTLGLCVCHPGRDSLESHSLMMFHEPSFRIWNTLGDLPD